jgi:hypothetical protein
MAIRFLGELAEVQPRSLIDGDAALRQFREGLAHITLADGEPLGRGRAHTLVERLLVGALENFGTEYMRAMGDHLDALVRLRAELSERFQGVIGHLRSGRDAAELPASLLDTNEIERLFNELDSHLEAIDRNTGRRALERDRHLAENPASRSGNPHDVLVRALGSDAEEQTAARRLADTIDQHGVAGALRVSGRTLAELESILEPQSVQAQRLLEYQVDEAFARLERGEGEWQARRAALERMRHGKPISATHVPDVGRGVTRTLVEQVRHVLGHKISDAPLEVREAWARAVDSVADKSDPIHAYKLAQPRFWAEVRADPLARAWFEANGFRFEGTRAPYVAVAESPTSTSARQELNLTLDHIEPKAGNPALALDPSNLRFLSGWDNWLLYQLEGRLREIDEMIASTPRP